MLVTTSLDKYIYIADIDRAEYLGRHDDGIWDQDVLDLFAMSREETLEKFHSPEHLPEYVPPSHSQSHCVVCLAKPGETHRLGCPVEICPWCGGQLTNCNCRFTKMGKEELTTEKEVEAFLDLLNDKGRIPYDTSQKLGGLLE
jgi:hypothetical protein